jgi:hypothetical protein
MGKKQREREGWMMDEWTDVVVDKTRQESTYKNACEFFLDYHVLISTGPTAEQVFISLPTVSYLILNYFFIFWTPPPFF